VTQSIIVVEAEEKREALRRLLRNEDVKNAIIFCNRKRDVDILNRSLVKHGFDAAALHGDMPQSKRMETLERFRNGDVRLLVASDVAARGLDIQGMSHVFNFDVPIHAEDYVHRIGRTGRAGREGRAFTLAAPEEGRFVQAIEQLIGRAIPPGQVEGLDAAALVFEEKRARGGRRGERKGRKERKENEAREAAEPREKTARRGGRDRDRERDHRPEGRVPQAPRHAPVTMDPTGKVTPLPVRPERRHSDAEDGARVVGFGDHMPAFLARPARAARG
jgi:superfamily II DNA/RNA helicase